MHFTVHCIKFCGDAQLMIFMMFVTICSFHVSTQLGVGCHWWFNYPGPLFEVELACLSG